MDPQTQTFLFSIVSDLGENQVVRFREFLHNLRKSIRWALGPPELVDNIEILNPLSCDDPIRTFGLVFQVYSAIEPYSLDGDLDRKHLEEVKHIIVSLSAFSKDFNCDFECELDGEVIGEIICGDVDDGLSLGLVAEWERALSQKPG